MRNHRLAALVGAAAMATAAALAAASPAHAETTFFELQNGSTSWCLQPDGGSSGAGVLIIQETCDGSPVQQWTRTASSSGFHLVNLATGLCLDARGGAADGTPIEQWPCDWISNENWKYLPGPQLASGVSGTYTYCLTAAPGGLFYPSPLVELLGCGGATVQYWY